MSATGENEPQQATAPVQEGAVPAPAATAEGVPAKAGKLKWYAVRTYSGYENKAKKGLEDRIRLESLQELFGDILVPTETVQETVRGAKRTTKRKSMPGYILVQMVLNDRSFHAVKNTPKVTGFVGSSDTNPPAMRDEEIARLTSQMTEGVLKPKPRVVFEEGNTVRVTEGPFANFTGTVEEVKPEKNKLRVTVSIFGRPTPVELEFTQVERVG
ncbi:MAG: transcription termination/antitermination protein NusG [Deltaproteobacteria bacterium]|nr:transcription termination/antitermination protein NusG [Deltaproteobacteria bacterium]